MNQNQNRVSELVGNVVVGFVSLLMGVLVVGGLAALVYWILRAAWSYVLR